jgi:DNA helicase HerA-like ATPase
MGKIGDNMTEIKGTIEASEKIGVIGSPSSTGNMTIDVLGTAVDKRLVGNLSVFNYTQEGTPNYALGQIVEIEMKNVWTQDPTMRGLIRLKGRVDPVTERQDTHTATFTVSSVFSERDKKVRQDVFGTVPPTGTYVYELTQNILNKLLQEYKEQLFYLGNAYGTQIKLPMWFKHFGENGLQSAGEAYHIGIFGKTGSGKSVLAKMTLSAYARHKDMSIFILDPQGEFSEELENFTLLRKIISDKLDREIKVYSLHNLVLTGWSLFEKILVNSGFLQRKLGVFQDTNREQAATQITRLLKQIIDKEDKLKIGFAHERAIFDVLWIRLNDDEILSNIYSGQEYQQRVRNHLLYDDQNEVYEEWRKIARLFTFDGKKDPIWIKKLVKKVSDEKQIISIDLSEINVPDDLFWNESIKMVVIGEILINLTQEAEVRYKERKSLNSLVIIDEAHRLAPREKVENEEFEKVKTLLIDAIRTTRKYGLGWMFISQTLSSLHREIINQIRIYIFGFGLGWGIERQALREIIGGQDEAMSLYQRFRDPQSSIGEKTYSFMSYGPISPLSFSGTPLFFNAFNYPEEFKDVNFEQRSGTIETKSN